MATLRLTQSAGKGGDEYRVEIAYEGDSGRETATTDFHFAMTPQDREDVRWYMEDYLEHAADPAPTIAKRVEGRMATMGTDLFKALFQSSDDGRDLWATVRDRLTDTRVEVVTGVKEAASLPWELLRDPKTDRPFALRAQAFVRTVHNAAKRSRVRQAKAGEKIRILLVICRPGGSDDVPFRSVASRLIKGLSEAARETFDLHVLRPPTFAQLGKVLRAAKAAQRPYHVVHFDGHGTYEDVIARNRLAELLRLIKPVMLSTPRAGRHGYLLFENASVKENIELVDGPSLGNLLVETDVPVLVLNACRSAHAEAPAAPESVGGAEPSPRPAVNDRPDAESPVNEPEEQPRPNPLLGNVTLHPQLKEEREPEPDVHTQVRALGSLAQEVMDAGAAGVVAMRYNVYVVTAAQFVADLYAALATGLSLGEAVTLGRKQLHDQPNRTIAYAPRPLQDWPVLIVYEAVPVALFPKPAAKAKRLKIDVTAGASAADGGAAGLPPPPDAGFFGRDETLLALDRAFDTQRIVLLHAYAGSGKTTTAAEFARWYMLTGGLEGAALFTTFEQHKPLARVLDTFGQAFGAMLEQAGVNWPAIVDDGHRQGIALQVFQQIPVLWIWDNVEPIAGFPAGTASLWTSAEQKEILDFLRAARETKAKFLLTSRRDERGWLGDLPRRISVPAMPMQERVQLARELAEKHGRRLTEVEDWRPLLRFTQGNPLTITVLVGQALRDGLKTARQIAEFVERLSHGEAAFDDEAVEGRSKSLGASLSYGFEHAFTEAERKQLALLHFFQGFVDVDALCWMGRLGKDWTLPEMEGFTRESGVALLDRAAEVGLLTAHGNGYYSIHPALPWFFKSLFERCYPDKGPAPSPFQGEGWGEVSTRLRAARAYVEAMGGLGDYYHGQFQGGNRDVIDALAAEEANLLHARQLARTNGWWGPVVSAMQGLRSLYGQTGRRAEWAQLVNEIVPDFVDPATDGPQSGREEDWSLVTDYRVRLAMESRQWEEAERLQHVRVEWDRRRAAAALAMPLATLDSAQRNEIRTLGVSVFGLGQIQRELGLPECIQAYEESLGIDEHLGDRPGAAISAFNIGHAYKNIAAIRDLDKAEHWYRRSLELHDERDGQGRAGRLGQLGYVAWERFKEARAANRSESELVAHLNAAAQFYLQALDLLPANAVNDLAVTHNQLGSIYGDAGDLDRALTHYRESIRYDEASGNVYGAATTRRNVAIDLANAGRLVDAREYALAALRNYETFGDRASDKVRKTRGTIAWIEGLIAGT